MQFLTLFSFFANNSRMKQPTPVFLSYMDFPYAIEGGSTKKFFWVLNKLYMAKREAILSIECLVVFLLHTVVGHKLQQAGRICFFRFSILL